MSDVAYVSQRAVRARMQCGGAMAGRIAARFTTAEQLLEAVEGERSLTDIKGFGPKTAETIEDWYENRHEREEEVSHSEFERTGAKTAKIHNLGDWSDTLNDEG